MYKDILEAILPRSNMEAHIPPFYNTRTVVFTGALFGFHVTLGVFALWGVVGSTVREFCDSTFGAYRMLSLESFT